MAEVSDVCHQHLKVVLALVVLVVIVLVEMRVWGRLGGWVEKRGAKKNPDRGHSHGAAAPLPPSAIGIELN